MLTVGIAGQLATGKSTVTDEFTRLGAKLVSGDEIGRQVVSQNKAVQRGLVRAFGIQILDSKGRVNRAMLADLAFASSDSLQTMNKIVHPPLLKELRRQMHVAGRLAKVPMLAVDAALIFEWGLHAELDVTILVDAPRKLQLEWIKNKGLSQEEGLKRIRLQMPKYKQRSLADFVILNRGSESELRKKAALLYQKLIRRGSGQN